MNNSSKRYPVEMRERAVRMVFEHQSKRHWLAPSVP